MANLFSDFRFAGRMLWKHRALTASALATISLAIAANTAIFSLVSSVLLQPLPLPQPAQLVRVEERHAGQLANLTGATFFDLRERARSFAAVAAFRINSPGLAAAGPPEQVTAAQVSEDYFAVLGVAPALGRTFEALDFAPGARRVVVLGDGLWRRVFGADRGAVGRVISLNAVPTEIVGVMPPGIPAPGSPQIWVPQTPASALPRNRRAHLFTVMARISPDTTLERARREVDAVSGQIVIDSQDADEGLGLVLTPLQDRIVEPVRPALLALWAAVGLLLLIGSANVANLLLMQGTARAREISIRAALGASRARIVRQLGAEALLLGTVAGLLGVMLGLWTVPVLRGFLPAALPRAGEVVASADVVAFGFLLSILTCVAFGALPALRSAGSAPAGALRDRHGDAPAHSWLRTAFVTAQVALTVVLLAGAGLLARSFLLVSRVDPGFDPSGTLAFDLSLPAASYPDARAHAALLTRIVDGVRGIPGVQHAGATGALPLAGTAATTMVPEGSNPASTFLADVIPALAGVFEALRIPVKDGRLITEADTPNAAPVMLVNEAAAQSFWPHLPSVVGRRVTMREWGDPYEAVVVGVVGSVRQAGPDTEVRPAVYYPLGQFPETMIRYSIVLRTAGDPVALVGAVRDQVWRADPKQPIASVRTMNDALAAAVAARRFNLIMIGAFAAAALALAALGLYGILAFAVGQRTREIGVRLALGAPSREVVRVVLTSGAVPVVTGLAAGLGGALAASRAVEGLLFGVDGRDGVTLVAVSALVVMTALASSLAPIRRALRVDPVAVLRD